MTGKPRSSGRYPIKWLDAADHLQMTNSTIIPHWQLTVIRPEASQGIESQRLPSSLLLSGQKTLNYQRSKITKYEPRLSNLSLDPVIGAASAAPFFWNFA